MAKDFGVVLADLRNKHMGISRFAFLSEADTANLVKVPQISGT